MSSTKERILRTALRLFARSGFEAVSVSDIAKELGVTKGALYKHYASKRDIFASIVARMEVRDAEQANAHGLPDAPMQGAEDAYRDASINDLTAFGKTMFRYWTQDEFAACFRRMLTLEQFRNTEMETLYQQYLASGPLDYITDLLDANHIPQPRKEASAFYAPMFLLYSIYDAARDKTEVVALADELLERAREHLMQIKGKDN